MLPARSDRRGRRCLDRRCQWWCLGGARRTVFLLAILAAVTATAAPTVLLPKTGLDATELGVVINDDDPLSRQIGEYYVSRRGVPAANVVRVRFPAAVTALTHEEFARIRSEVLARTPAGVQAWALAWAAPYRVDCMGITSAFAFGFDPAYCSRACAATRPSPYFDAPSVQPFTDLAIRPAMLLATRSFEQARALIARGIAADGSMPAGTAYLLRTSDKARSSRAVLFEATAKALAPVFHIEVLDADSISGRHDVLFYFTGVAHVPDLDSLGFLPGALADHLTSAGGMLTDSRQMSALNWLEAGATASYGTVTEPCNHPQKFPAPAVAMFHYAAGATAIEAYWKSVAWPGEGVFVGEPLARPFAPSFRQVGARGVEVSLYSPTVRRLLLEAARSPVGPFRGVGGAVAVKPGRNTLRLRLPDAAAYYRLRLL